MIGDELNQLSGRIAEADSRETLNSVVENLSSAFCVNGHFFGAIQINSNNQSTLATQQMTTLSSDLCPHQTERYIDRQLSPLWTEHKRGVGKNVPKIWNTRDDRWEHLATGRRRFLKDRGPAAKPEAMALFSQLNGTSFGVLAVTRPCLKSELDVSAFHSMGLRIFDRMASFQEAERLPALSKSERGCLLWSACGKTSHEISIILSLSEHTVNHYFSVAAGKLGANNRTHAVAKAISMGLIDIAEIA